ncbi:Maf family protein [Acidomonas methanolica]|uniref:Maf family protein n=1 Tax=Acidomonas methanolica TaxID=437 RepID=UPI00211A0A78|nr:Maf family protein [Acidomonas methanolica]MCQ9154127.1 Maf family protein [Acidomonas methanolica]
MVRLVLASGSVTRLALLRESGVVVEACPAFVDEAGMRAAFLREGVGAGEMALRLARAKAEAVALSDGLVIAGDQILACDGEIFGKAATRAAARRQLLALRGRTHTLPTAVTLFRDGREIWSHVETPCLTMRAFSEAFLDDYLAAEGDALLACVGAYRLEGRGMQLFAAVEGSHDAILGLPRLPLFGALREAGALAT